MNRYKTPPGLPGEEESHLTSQAESSAGKSSSPLGRLGGTNSISVVIPNYNGKHLLEANLPSIYAALKFANVNYEVIVVDDASADDSAAYIKQNYPDIILLINESNRGFSPTINKGIFAARHELILALNSDVQLSDNYFIEQFKYFDSAETFGVMGKIVDINGSKVQDGAKYTRISFKGIKTTLNYLPSEETSEIWLPSFFLSGANALMNREKLWMLGGFDELYAPYYYEDADLGIRAWRVGWKCYFESKSICIHAHSSSISKLKPEKVRIIAERNRITLNHLHLSDRHLSFFKFWLRVRCCIKLIKGDSTIYKAMQMFGKDRVLVKQSKKALIDLQTKYNKYFTVYDTEKYILKKTESIKYRIF